MKKSYLKSIYKFDELRDTFMLEISIEDYSELFNGWDASPIKKKDIDPELSDYLNTVSSDIPIKENIDIIFIIPKTKKNETLEHKAQKAFINYYNANNHFLNRLLHSNYKKIFAYILLGFLFITTAYVLKGLSVTLPFDIIKEGLFIGGWVFLWESFSLFFFVTSESRIKRRQNQRFADTTIRFEYID